MKAIQIKSISADDFMHFRYTAVIMNEFKHVTNPICDVNLIWVNQRNEVSTNQLQSNDLIQSSK